VNLFTFPSASLDTWMRSARYRQGICSSLELTSSVVQWMTSSGLPLAGLRPSIFTPAP